MTKYATEEERLEAIKETKRRWRRNNLEQDRASKRASYHKCQEKLGLKVKCRKDKQAKNSKRAVLAASAYTTTSPAPLVYPVSQNAYQPPVNDSEGGMATWSNFTLKTKVEVRCFKGL